MEKPPKRDFWTLLLSAAGPIIAVLALANNWTDAKENRLQKLEADVAYIKGKMGIAK